MNRNGGTRFEIPRSLRGQLMGFRRRLWSQKLFEAVAFAGIGFLLGFLITYLFDRFGETSRVSRWCAFSAATTSAFAIPYAIERWIWKRRRFEQLAELMTRQEPAVGDQVLGVIHLASDQGEQSRSPELVNAAITQVARQLAGQDFSSCIPSHRARRRAAIVSCFALICGMLFGFSADAAANAWSRFMRPWSDVKRFTFATIEPLDSPMIVPKGEPIGLSITLKPSSQWLPALANLRLASSVPYAASNENNRFKFELPAQVVETPLDLSIGDYRERVVIRPVARPEMKELVAVTRLPEYLQRDTAGSFEIRGRKVPLLKGTEVTLEAEISRELIEADVNGRPVAFQGDAFSAERLVVTEDVEVNLSWKDRFGLTPEKAFDLQVMAIEDQIPTLLCENLPLRKVLLTSEVLTFQVRAYDDYGVKHVGLEWFEVDEEGLGESIGETLLGGGGPYAESVALDATFSVAEHGIERNVIALRAFVEDYQLGARRQYSSPSYFQILENAEHAVWLNSELTRWHQMSLDVRDRELQLHQTNRTLQQLSAEQLATAETRELISKQAESERNNGRQLANLVRSGEALLREAMRNDEIEAESLENWAEMVQVLKEISSQRMPKVADLLDQAAKGDKASAGPSGKPNDSDSTKVGQNRLETPSGAQADEEGQEESDEDKPQTPSVSDIESSQLDLENLPKAEGEKQKSQAGRLGFADTKLAGNASSDSKPSEPQEELDQAVIEQEGLLEEFEKVSGEMNEIMGKLEGSTLVKRLKSASRKQQQVATGLTALATNTFGVPDREKHADRDAFVALAELEAEASREVSNLMDDMTAYFERSRLQLLQRVLEQMKTEDVTAGLRDLGDQLRQENGLSISQAEYWSDNLDRWAEDLVEVTQSGESPGGKPKGSLPPGVVLEVLQILDDEVQLREQTRVAEQKRAVVTDTQHMNDANRLGEMQEDYQNRVETLIDQILELPNAEGDFANELNLLGQVAGVMQEATEILYKPQTGPTAIAAETEAIELLLKSKRFNPNASGGSGSDPGGGGDGQTEVAALALVGTGINAREVREESDAAPATGVTQLGLPEEFRGGLDQYFSRLEAWKAK